MKIIGIVFLVVSIAVAGLFAGDRALRSVRVALGVRSARIEGAQ